VAHRALAFALDVEIMEQERFGFADAATYPAVTVSPDVGRAVGPAAWCVDAQASARCSRLWTPSLGERRNAGADPLR
jgi:hypothetical protein